MTVSAFTSPLCERLLHAKSAHAHGAFDTAVTRYTALLPDLEQHHEPAHPTVLDARLQLAFSLYGLARYPQAEQQLRIVVEARTALHGPAHADTLDARARARLAEALAAQDLLEQAETLLAQAVRDTDHLPAPEREPALADLRLALAWLHYRREQYAQAVALIEPAHAQLAAAHGDDHHKTVSVRTLWADCLTRTGNHTSAASHASAALQTRTLVLGADHPYTLYNVALLASIENSAGNTARAAELARAALPKAEQALGGEHPLTTRLHILSEGAQT
ncbi:tetratricopeptide repeat protein [Streptomyces sp. NPDC050085]|uniref:tetratricopeptide repeat protein n=1 Tax=Streptomyces sp. NPDC050085 TaxID=3365600 RepID=UPI0037B0AE56